MTGKCWQVAAVAAAMVGALAVVRVVPAAHADTVPDGGGWAHAGAWPDGKPAGETGGKAGGNAGARSAAGAASVPAGFSAAGIDRSSHAHSVDPIHWACVAARRGEVA